jgi:site-specific recombinase XerD
LNSLIFMQRLGPPQFAYLRAVAEGVPRADAAKRYLAIHHATEAITAHRLVVEQAQALARRGGDSRWRLLSIEIADRTSDSSASAVPTVEQWAVGEGLEGWSEAEIVDMYIERFGADDQAGRRRQARNTRLRRRRLELVAELAHRVQVAPSPHDLLSGWLPAPLADRLINGGDLTLGDLQQRIAAGGRWYSHLPSYGPTKAARLAGYVRQLLGEPAPMRVFALPAAVVSRLSGRHGRNRSVQGEGAASGIVAEDDRAAIQAWIAARAGSSLTAKMYEREAERFVLWCVLERGQALSDATTEDCRAYMDFLADVPAHWIGGGRLPRLSLGWRPFAKPLSVASQRLAVTILNALFTWLVQARYLASNPWVLVNRKLGDDRAQDDDITSRAFTPQAWTAMLQQLRHAPDTAANQRLRWLLPFVEATGLRAAELIQAQRQHLKPTAKGWLLRVHGKGRRNRTVPVSSSAMEATQLYFKQRGLNFDEALPHMPLLASAVDFEHGISYASLYETFTRFVKRVAKTAPPDQRQQLERGSTHWLRHTHATRAAERGMPADILQENLGQGDPRTTARYFRAQIERRQAAMELAFDGR